MADVDQAGAGNDEHEVAVEQFWCPLQVLDGKRRSTPRLAETRRRDQHQEGGREADRDDDRHSFRARPRQDDALTRYSVWTTKHIHRE
jgi:hypothetical protein